jgi:Amidohydrolase
MDTVTPTFLKKSNRLSGSAALSPRVRATGRENSPFRFTSGFLPYQIGRLDRGYAAHPACKRIISKSPGEFLRSFYYDTLTHNTNALDYLTRSVGTPRVLYGSDYPFEMLDESGPARVRDLLLPSEGLGAILGGNAQMLLKNRPAGSSATAARANTSTTDIIPKRTSR